MEQRWERIDDGAETAQTHRVAFLLSGSPQEVCDALSISVD